MTEDPRKYWVALNMVKGIGAVRMQALRTYFGDFALAWQAPSEALKAAGLNEKIVERLIQVRTTIDLEKILQQIDKQGIKIITWDDNNYPRRLKEISQPPPLLYVKGSLIPEDDWAVAIVGTRRATAYGQQVAAELATALAQCGVTVVSGLARGIDAIAHINALNAGGRSLAVLGNGIDQVYPPENRLLAEKMVVSGALISDYPLGTRPEGTNFPPRNRIISGLSMVVVVIEAGKSSGALITAEFAAEQGRDVFAVPGNILAPQSAGTNRLIQDGARPFLSVQDLLEALDATKFLEQKFVRKAIPADAIESQLLETIKNEPLHIDEIRNKTGLPIEKVSSTLVLMELRGLVKHVGAGAYVAIHDGISNYIAREKNE